MLRSILARLLVSLGFVVNAAAGTASEVGIIIETSMGALHLELDAEKAPHTVANFLAYVDDEFYVETQFHRVIPGFVIQGGGLDVGMEKKKTREPVVNESANGLKNLRGTISMARSREPDTATSQFFINLADNVRLDHRKTKAGYTVFGRVTQGMQIADRIAAVPTMTRGEHRDVPEEAIAITSIRRKDPGEENSDEQESSGAGSFIEGEHYTLLKSPVRNRRAGTIEVVEAFSYGCTRCFRMNPLVAAWRAQQSEEIDFWHFHAVWNPAMKLYAQAYHSAKELGVLEEIHLPLFTNILIDHAQMRDEQDLAHFFAQFGVSSQAFSEAFESPAVAAEIAKAETLSRRYNLASVPEFVVNGKYRVDPMRAGGHARMLRVIDYLIVKERAEPKE